MTFEELQKANATIKTMQIKRWDKKQGKEIVKDYAEVNERIKAFRMLFPNGTISTDIVSLEDGVCVMKAIAMNEAGMILATGYAYEKENSSLINQTSFIENAETSAVGRCLGMLGIGIDTSIASYEEVSNAMEQQNQQNQPEEAPKPKKAKKQETKKVNSEARSAFKAYVESQHLSNEKILEILTDCGITNESSEQEWQMGLDYARLLIEGGNG